MILVKKLRKKRAQGNSPLCTPPLPALYIARRGRKYRTQKTLPWVKYDDPRLSVANWGVSLSLPIKLSISFRKTTPNGFKFSRFVGGDVLDAPLSFAHFGARAETGSPQYVPLSRYHSPSCFTRFTTTLILSSGELSR